MISGLNLTFDYWETLSHVVKLGLAYLLALSLIHI